MTHIGNIAHIIEHGITHAGSKKANPDFISIGDGSLIGTRKNFVLNNGKLLGEYIPFYFAYKTPMLYVVQKGYNQVKPIAPEEIVYCVTSVQKILEFNIDFIFTDGHAFDRFSTQYTPRDIEKISEIIDWEAIKAKYWNIESDLDLKRRKEAEFLVLGDIPIECILGYIVFNLNSQKRLVENGINPEKISIKPDYYFKP